MFSNGVSVVLAHGAWADGSSWAKVIEPLAAAGANVVAAPLPLTSFHDDVTALDQTLERVAGAVVLVGHAYAGAVIAATRSEKVKALIYVAALAPDEGETVADVFYRTEPHPQAPKLAPDDYGLIYLPEAALRRRFRAKRIHSGTERAGGGPTTDFVRLHHRPDGTAPLEGSAELVLGSRTGPHDRPGEPALHGRADEGADPFTSGRSRTAGDSAFGRPGHYPRSVRSGPRGLTTPFPAQTRQSLSHNHARDSSSAKTDLVALPAKENRHDRHAERRLEPDPGLLAGRVAGQPRGVARLPQARDDCLAVHARRPRCDEGLPGRLLTIFTWPGSEPTRPSSTCSATTRATFALDPTFQAYFRTHKPLFLAVWGKKRSVLSAARRRGVQTRHPKRGRPLLRYRSSRA